MSNLLMLSTEELRTRRESLRAELAPIAERTEPTAEQSNRFNELSDGIEAIDAELERRRNDPVGYDRDKAAAVRAGIANGSVRTESGAHTGPEAVTGSRRNPFADLDAGAVRSFSARDWTARADDALEQIGRAEAVNRDSLARMVDREGGRAGMAVTVLGNPAYQSAFNKIIRNPERAMFMLTDDERAALAAVESMRAALGTGTGTAGYLIPLALSPSVQLANDGAANPFRSIARIEQTVASPYRMPKTTGVTAEWKVESAEGSDATPTFTKVDVDLHAISAVAYASYEIMQDSAYSLEGELTRLFQDARDRIEADAFAVGSGSGAPTGVVTAVAAVTTSRVDPTTAGAFSSASAADVFKVFNGLPPRARQSRSMAWIAHNDTLSIIRQMGSTEGAYYTVSMDEAQPDRLLGAQVFEASAMDSAVTTGSNLLLAGDFSAYSIVDHVAGASVVYQPRLGTSGNLPTGEGVWHYFARTGAHCRDESQFRVLQL